MDIRKHFSHQMKAFPGAPNEIDYILYSPDSWSAFKKLVGRDQEVLDVGCGGGTLLNCLRQAGYHKLHGCDLHYSVGEELIPSEEYSFFECDLMEQPLPENQFGGVLSTMVIEHVPDDRLFLERIAESLKPGGVTLVTSVIQPPLRWYFYRNPAGERVLEPTHLREYASKAQFLELFPKQLEILDVWTPRLTYPIVDPLLKSLYRLTSISALTNLEKEPLRTLRHLKVPIPGYRAVEVLARKRA